MASRAPISPHSLQRHGYEEAGVRRVNIALNKGRVSDALHVFDGPCVILSMFMEITEAVANTACNMSWVLRSDAGGYRVIGDTVNIQAAAKGDFFWAELDGTNIIKATTSTGLIHGGFNRKVIAATDSGEGTIVPPGGIDIVLTVNNLTSGKGTLYVWYRPLVFDANIVAEDLRTSTTSSTTTSSSTSSTSSTASTSSSTSSTSSTASTTSSTSSTSSTASTTSSTSSTASTSSTTSSTTTAP